MKLFNTRLILTSSLLSLALLPAAAQKRANVSDIKYSIQDSSIVYPESFETDTQKLLENWYLKNYTSADIKATSTDPGATPAQIRERLASMPTVIEMPYNDVVLSYIERYTKKGRSQVAALLGLSTYYMPIFEQALEEAGLPLELKYLPVIESALDPTATSVHGAAGLWQFMVATARGYDMEVNSLVDERRDPYISSRQACCMLKDLYNSYGDWSLAIAAYNCGPGTVNKALARAGGDASAHDFWSIYYLLPAETRGYVPAFIAANYVMTYYPHHGISPVLATKPLITDTIHVSNRIHLNQIATVLNIPVEELRILNPQFKADIIPASASRAYNLILPSQQVHAFLVSEDQILAFDREKYARRTDVTPGGDISMAVEEELAITDSPETAYAEDLPTTPEPVASAQPVSMVAQQPSIPSEEPIVPRRRRTESPRQAAQAASQPAAQASAPAQSQTQVQAPAQTQAQTSSAPAPAKKAASTASASSSKKQTASQSKKKAAASKPKDHAVSNGENLTTIAKKYGVSVSDLKKANPNLKNPDKINAGDKLKLPSSAKSSGSKSNSKKKGRR